MRPPALVSAVALVALTLASRAAAEDLHVAPGASGDGSEASPFGDVGDALGAAADGDTIVLHEGDYGDVSLAGVFGSETVVRAADGEAVRMRSVEISATHLTLRGVSISLGYGDPYETKTMVSVTGSSRDVTVADCEVFSVPDETTASWNETDWANLPGTGIGVRAPDTTLLRNTVRNVGYGISIGHDAPNALVRENLVENFSRDGLRGIGDYGVFEYNVVKNAYDVDEHHDDFFQSWSLGEDGTPGGGVRRGVVLRGNVFINFDDPAQPYAGAAQGVGCFDGFFEDWVVENNVVIVNHWHGITFLGARNVRIVNNTVIDNRAGERPGPPWIQIGPHKDGRPSENVVVRNNLTMDLDIVADGAAEDHNLVLDDLAAFFVDVDAHDLRLRQDAAEAIDQGVSDDAPALDADGIPRPQGAGIDLGAYEWHDGSIEPVDGPGAGGPGAGGSGGAGGGPAGATDDGGCAVGFRRSADRSWALLLLAGWSFARRRGRRVAPRRGEERVNPRPGSAP